MAREKGQRFRSDERRWFRLESPQLADDTAELSDSEFRAFVLILAWANETKAHERKDTVYIARNRLPSVAPNKRGSVATSARVVRELCAKQSWSLHESDGKWSIHIRNYSQKQGFPPTKPRRPPSKPPATTTTTTTTPRERGAPQETRALAETFDPIDFPNFEPRSDQFYADFASPVSNPTGMQLTAAEVADWHAWQWFQRGLDKAKPKGRTNALRNRWSRLNEFVEDELGVAAKWCGRIRRARRRAEVDAACAAGTDESPPPGFQLNFEANSESS